MKPLLATLREVGAIKALAHITGGGFTENIPRVLPEHFAAEIDLDAFEVPAVFKWLATEGGVAAMEMLRTFNCGVGMVAVVEGDQAAQAIAILQREGEHVEVIGRIIPRRDHGVAYIGALDL